MTITYEQAYNKLDSIVESALVNFECEVLTEGVDVGKAFRVVKAAIIKLIDTVINFVKQLAVKFKARGIDSVPYKAGELKAAVDRATADSLCASISKVAGDLRNGDVNTNANAAIKLGERTTADGTVSKADIIAILNTVHKTTAQLKAEINRYADNDPDAAKKLEIIKGYVTKLNQVANAVATVVGKAGESARADAKAQKAADAAKAAAGKAQVPSTQSESATVRMAKLLVEAAAILEEAEGGDAAVEAHPYVDGIEGGEGTQDPIDDIPEEKPEEAADPAPEVSGGEGAPVDLEEIKELVGDDKEAIALMTEDEGSAVCEAVEIDFGF